MDGREDRTDLMPNVSVTIGALDLMVGHMVLVHELGCIFRRQDFRLIMALNTFPFGNMTIPLDDMDMASFTGDASGNILPVIETPALDLDIAFGFNMAGGTSSDRAGNTLLLSFRAGIIVMADEAIDLMNGEVGSLDELGMAGGTAEFHPSSQFA
jgi:hypothetical protein